MRKLLVSLLLFLPLALSAQQDNLGYLREQMRLNYEKGDFGKAMSFGLSLVTEAGNLYGLADPRVGEALESVGKLCLDMGEYASAAQWYHKALGHRQNNIGSNSPETGRCYAYLGEVGLETRENELAEGYLNKSIEMLRGAGPDYAEWLAQPLELLAALRYMQDSFTAAETLYQEVAGIQENTQGMQSAGLARTLNNLAGVFQAQGKYQRAKGVYSHALNMQRAVLGPEHPETATTLVNLGVLYDQLGEFDQAETKLKEALFLREKKLPLSHPLTSQTIDNLISLYLSIGNYDKAEATLAEILKRRTDALGSEALEIAPVYEKYASYYLAREDAATALSYLEKALMIRENQLGPRDGAVAASLYNLGRLCNLLGRFDQARILLNRALDIFDTQQPGDQGVITALLAEIMITDYSQGRMDLAEQRLDMMLQIKQRVFGSNHPETMAVLQEMKVFYQKTGQEEALHNVEQRLQKNATRGND